jgi:ABC-2 type transport system ATP-binding protein
MQIEAESLPDGLESKVKADVDGVSRLELLGKNEENSANLLTVFAKRGRKALPRILSILEHENLGVQSVEVREPDLEAVFLQLTGRALRD